MIPNNFNTTPDGTTVINISNVINLPTTMIVSASTTPYIDNLMTLNPTKTTFLFNPGTYKLLNILKITKRGIKFIGMTNNAKDVQIVQTMNADAIAINTNNVILQNISITCTFSKKSCLITAGINNTVVAGCYFYATSDHFGIYYAGAPFPTSVTIEAYTNYAMDTGNIFYNNVIYSNYSGDSVSFSLQYRSQFVGNIVRGGKVAIYMCRTTNVYNNTIIDSNTNGFFVSFPSDNLSIVGNKIYNSKHSGICMKNQTENTPFTPYDYNIIVDHNTVFNSYMYGIEMNNANSITITNNKLASGQTMGIYSYNGNKINISLNDISYFNYCIYLQNTSNSVITKNNIMSLYPNAANNAIKILSPSQTNTVSENNIFGKFTSVYSDNGINDKIISNNIDPFYTLNQELSIYTVI